jgi:hypothetical protein
MLGRSVSCVHLHLCSVVMELGEGGRGGKQARVAEIREVLSNRQSQ